MFGHVFDLAINHLNVDVNIHQLIRLMHQTHRPTDFLTVITKTRWRISPLTPFNLDKVFFSDRFAGTLTVFFI